jgi:hypothetical protein
MPAKAKPPSETELNAFLGPAAGLWFSVLRAIEDRASPLDLRWRPSKAAFGRICLVQHRKRTLFYLTPDTGKIWIGIVIGERAYGLAMASSLPAAIKKMFAEAKPYAEGRGIRYPVDSMRSVPVIAKLLEIKTTPK